MGTLTKPIAYPSQDILRFVFPANTIPTWTVDSTNAPDETINVPQYTNQELADALAAYIADLPVQQANDAALEEAEAQEIINLINNSNANGSMAPSLYFDSGRLYLRRDDWYTGADDTYGYGHYSHAESANDNTVPEVEWEHIGLLIPAGRKLGRLHIAGRSNSSSVSDLEIYACLKEPNPTSRWETGVDSDNEISVVPLHHDRFLQPTVGTQFSGNLNDMHWRTIDLDHVAVNDSMFLLYMRPWNYNSSSRRYFYHTWTLEVY